MFSRKVDGPLSVQIPTGADDKPSWSRVGVIAAIGFIIGVAWPRLAGVRLGPSVPETQSTTASASPPADSAPAPTPSGPSPSLPAVAATPAPMASSAASPASVSVAHGAVFACKTSDGDSLKGGDCGTLPGLDALVQPRLRKLAECPDAASANGKLHLVLHVDFPKGNIDIDLGKTRGVSSSDALLACAKTEMGGAALSGIAHENPRYSVAYSVTLGSGSSSAPSASAAAPSHAGGEAESGPAQVVWEVAIVRDAPKTGKVVARLQRGAELHLGAPKDGWYPVKYGDGFASDGWVYRGAIGK